MMHKVKIAVDAMGGENSPKKILKGIQISLESNKENYFYLYGNSNLLKSEISKNKLLSENCEIISAEDSVTDEESPLTAAKKGKQSSMWKAIESLKVGTLVHY